MLKKFPANQKCQLKRGVRFVKERPINFMGSEKLPSAYYILSDESSIPFYSTRNGYKEAILSTLHDDPIQGVKSAILKQKI